MWPLLLSIFDIFVMQKTEIKTRLKIVLTQARKPKISFIINPEMNGKSNSARKKTWMMKIHQFASCYMLRRMSERNTAGGKSSNKNKINVYNWHHWNGGNVVLWSYIAFACVWVNEWMSSARSRKWVGGIAIEPNTHTYACTSIDRFVINLFERLTRVYFWQANFYLCRSSRKAFLFAKKKPNEITRKSKNMFFSFVVLGW